MKRYRFTVEYEGPDEWNIGVTPGADPGYETTSQELADVLRSIADEIEIWPKKKPVAQVVYSPRGDSA